ncbi:uncharacterized protein BKA78DRAFT_363349 [Phyllosticta capitalensis]|uniref:uncharacterized protein n=1 Tax=Phyllosticta capitalensis TaxID=121624 RepID=UPI00312DAFE6
MAASLTPYALATESSIAYDVHSQFNVDKIAGNDQIQGRARWLIANARRVGHALGQSSKPPTNRRTVFRLSGYKSKPFPLDYEIRSASYNQRSCCGLAAQKLDTVCACLFSERLAKTNLLCSLRLPGGSRQTIKAGKFSGTQKSRECLFWCYNAPEHLQILMMSVKIPLLIVRQATSRDVGTLNTVDGFIKV